MATLNLVRFVLNWTMALNSTITHIDYAILGLIKGSPLTGYRIRLVFERTALGSFSSSPGTIYPALKRLLRLQLVKRKKVTGKSQEAFEITGKGTMALTDWILQPVTKDDVAKHIHIIVLRCAFMDGLGTTARQLQFLDSLKITTKAYLNELEEFYQNESINMPTGGRLAFEHGISSYTNTLKWVQKVIRTYRSKKK